MPSVFLNGRFVEVGEAKLSAFDAGLQHGVGLFETMLAVPGHAGPAIVGLGEHVTRLATSARELGLSDQLREGALADAALETVRRSGLTTSGGRARVRLTITGGDLNMLTTAGAAPSRDPTILIHAQPATPYPPEMLERGVSAIIADLKLNPLDPFAGHKTLNYWARLRELQAAAAKQAGEALVFQVTNHLAGGCVSNVFVVKGGTLFTPIARGEEHEVGAEASGPPGGPGAAAPARPLTQESRKGMVIPSPVLPGVTRAILLRRAEEDAVRVERRMLSIHEVLGADEVFLTNSSWGVLPVVRVEREAIGTGEAGELTGRARRWWNAEIESCE